MSEVMDFESLVTLYYGSLYQFAFSLTRTEAEACDLTQQTFYVWAKKGHQLREASKAKSWLFTTLHREFLQSRRRATRLPHVQIGSVEAETPAFDTTLANHLEGDAGMETLGQ